jgi:hydrogenase maturation protease
VTDSGVTVLVGGVYELFQGDLDLGRLAVERLRAEALPHVLAEDLHYGAVAVVQRLEDLRPQTLVLVTAVRRDRPPGTVARRRVQPTAVDPADFQAAVGDAVTGYVHVDLLVEVASGFQALPARTVAIEVEPAHVGPGEGLSPLAAAALEDALAMVRAEVRRAPLLQLVEELSGMVEGDRLTPSPGLDALRALLDELDGLDRHGNWGHTFALRDRMRLAIASASSSEGMDHRDWGLWWALIEELDRLEALEAVSR